MWGAPASPFAGRCGHAVTTTMSFRTVFTPGAFQAASPATFRSSHERTLPDSVTLPPSVATVTVPASIRAFRTRAFSMASLTAYGWAAGLGVMSFVTPFTSGIVEGRQTFANVTKYLLMGTSWSFGNMLSMAAAVAFLPFLPMLPLQVLLNKLLYDSAQLPIPADRVDPGLVRKPRKWGVAAIRRFTLVVGPVSSAFDLVTFAGLFRLFGVSVTAFHTGWFVESLFTQTLVVLVIRTAGSPFRSRPSAWLLGTVLAVCGVAVGLPFTPVAAALGFEPLPWAFARFLLAVAAACLGAVDLVKRRFCREIDAV